MKILLFLCLAATQALFSKRSLRRDLVKKQVGPDKDKYRELMDKLIQQQNEGAAKDPLGGESTGSPMVDQAKRDLLKKFDKVREIGEEKLNEASEKKRAALKEKEEQAKEKAVEELVKDWHVVEPDSEFTVPQNPSENWFVRIWKFLKAKLNKRFSSSEFEEVVEENVKAPEKVKPIDPEVVQEGNDPVIDKLSAHIDDMDLSKTAKAFAEKFKDDLAKAKTPEQVEDIELGLYKGDYGSVGIKLSSSKNVLEALRKQKLSLEDNKVDFDLSDGGISESDVNSVSNILDGGAGTENVIAKVDPGVVNGEHGTDVDSGDVDTKPIDRAAIDAF